MGSAANGNYLGMLELLAQYDDFLKQHIQKHANLGSGHTNYLSSTICEELVLFIETRVLDDIVSRIKCSRYYSVTLDSTPDEGHVDQLTLVFRFMENTIQVERFVTFMPNQRIYSMGSCNFSTRTGLTYNIVEASPTTMHQP